MGDVHMRTLFKRSRSFCGRVRARAWWCELCTGVSGACKQRLVKDGDVESSLPTLLAGFCPSGQLQR